MYDEDDIVQRVSVGDEVAFAEMFHHYAARLHLHIKALVKQPAIVEDILQETFVRVWIARDKLPEIVNIRAWILTIAANGCYNYLRSSFREELRIKNMANREPDMNMVQQQMDLKEIQGLIAAAVEMLSPQRKNIWRLHRDVGLKHAEIAEKLNISVSTVKNTISQALEFIREYLKKKGCHLMNMLVFIFFNFF